MQDLSEGIVKVENLQKIHKIKYLQKFFAIPYVLTYPVNMSNRLYCGIKGVGKAMPTAKESLWRVFLVDLAA